MCEKKSKKIFLGRGVDGRDSEISIFALLQFFGGDNLARNISAAGSKKNIQITSEYQICAGRNIISW